jgi:hypothetical protein
MESLADLLHQQTRDDNNTQGRILIIEDLSANMIEMLGSVLNIDPFFFASHIDVPYNEIGMRRASVVTLPSKLRCRNSLNLHYHRVLEFEHPPPKGNFFQVLNVPREVKISRSINGVHIGLAHQCCSIVQTVSKDGLWLGK